MRHQKAGRQLRRTSEQRLALLRNLATSLIESESIETTEAKA
jgi:large subunit ribosomal protein L17